MSSTIGSESVDRQRQRAQRGIGAAGSGSSGSRLPSAPRRRRPAIAALAALLIVGGALAAGLLAVRMDERQAVIQVSKSIAVGQKITEKDLAEARVAGDSIETIKVSDARAVIGQYATVNIKPGQLLVKGMFNSAAPIQDGKAAVGIVLVPGRVPYDGLHPGDRVELIRLGQGATPAAVIGEATVLAASADEKQSSSLGGQATTTSAKTATVLVDRGDVRAVTDASGNNRIGVALLKSGTSLEGK